MLIIPKVAARLFVPRNKRSFSFRGIDASGAGVRIRRPAGMYHPLQERWKPQWVYSYIYLWKEIWICVSCHGFIFVLALDVNF